VRIGVEVERVVIEGSTARRLRRRGVEKLGSEPSPEAVRREVDGTPKADFGASGGRRDLGEASHELGGVFSSAVVELEAGLVDVQGFVPAWNAEEKEADFAGGPVRGNEVGCLLAVPIAEGAVGNESERIAVLPLQLDHQVLVGHRIGFLIVGSGRYGQTFEGQIVFDPGAGVDLSA